MKIGGTLRFQGILYYVSLVETKNKISWYLVSEYHERDLHTLVTGEPAEFMVLTAREAFGRPIPVEYVVEGLERSKASGKTSMFKKKMILQSLTQALADSRAYHFATDAVIESRENIQGFTYHNFEGQDERMSLKFTRVNNEYYTHLELKYEDFDLYLDEQFNVRVPTRTMKFVPIKERENGKVVFHSSKSLDFETLCEVLDMSWYIEGGKPGGKVLKDYRPITSIPEFEEYVIDDLMREYQACVARGEKLRLGCDTETTGFIFYNLSVENEELDDLVAIPLSWRDNQGVVIFVDMEYFKNVPLDYVLHRLRVFLEDTKGDVEIEKRHVNMKKHDTLDSMHAFGSTAVIGDESEDEDAPVNWEVIGKYPFNRDKMLLIGHNILFDGRVFFHYGIKSKWDDDTLQMAFNLNPKVAKGSNKLKNLTRRIFGHETPELSDLLGKGNEDKYKYLTDIRVATIYGCADTDYTRQVHNFFLSIMDETFLKRYRQQDIDIMNVLYMSEYYGMQTDEYLLKQRADIVYNDLEELRKFLYNYVGVAVDYRNKRNALLKELEVGAITQEEFTQRVAEIKTDPKAQHVFELKGSSIRRVIYDILEYPKVSWTKDEKKRVPSVDKFAMKKLQSFKLATPGKSCKDHLYSTDPANANKPPEKRTKLIDAKKFNSLRYPIAYVLSEYAKLWKEWTSYYKPIKEQNLEGKIFKGYSLARIETRRIMNPGQTMKGDLKALIKPYGPDYYLVDFDQSQVEYRIMASLAKFEEVIKKMNDPEKDYHTETAATVHNRPAHKISKYLRKQTKGISFGVPYGLGEFKMTENLFDGVVNEETRFQTRMMLHDYKKANKPIIDMLDSYKAMAIEPVMLDPKLRSFIKAPDDPDDVPYGMVRGKLGFYRLFDLRDLDQEKKGKIQRPAGNYPIQNFAAELFRMILMRFYRRCVKEGIEHKVIWHMTIHDELLFSVHKSIHPFFIYKLLYEECCISIPGHTKYFIGINIGDSWADCKDDKNEAPITFVKRIKDRWDAGEFRDDNYADDVKGYVTKHKLQYIKERIGEVVRNYQPDIDTGVINIKKLMDNFENYTVRAYVSDFYSPNGPVYDKNNEDLIWISKFESWVLDMYGEGREALYPDGQVRRIYEDNSELIELDFDDSFSFSDEDEEEDEYFNFDEDEISESLEENYSVVSDEDDESDYEKFMSEFNTEVENARSVAELWITESPSYKNVKIINRQLLVNVDFNRHISKVKSFLAAKEDPDGYSVLFVTPIGQDRWLRVSKDVDLKKLDEFIETLT